jgi:hypothetical protein
MNYLRRGRNCLMTCRILLSIALGVDLFCSCQVLSAETNRVTVSVCSSRALSRSLQSVSEVLACRICYQEPAYYDVAEKSSCPAEGRHLSPKTYTFRFAFNRDDNKSNIVEMLLKEYKKIEPDVEYKIDTGTGMTNFYVYPLSWMGAGGKTVFNKDVLQNRVAIKGAEKETLKDSVMRILDNVALKSPYETRITTVMTPLQLSSGSSSAFQSVASEMTVKELFDTLCKMSSTMSTKSWHFLRRPGSAPSYVSFFSMLTVSSEHDSVISASCERPLAFCLDELERTYQCPINYEGPSLESSGCMIDVKGRPSAPLGSSVLFTYDSRRPLGEVLVDLIDSYRGRIAGVFYKLSEPVKGRLIVSPDSRLSLDAESMAKGQSSGRVDVIAVSRTLLTLSLKDADISAVQTKVCEELAKRSGIRIKEGEINVSQQVMERKINFVCADQPMGACLSEILSKYSALLSWRLLYEPIDQGYKLTIHEVEAIGVSPKAPIEIGRE